MTTNFVTWESAYVPSQHVSSSWVTLRSLTFFTPRHNSTCCHVFICACQSLHQQSTLHHAHIQLALFNSNLLLMEINVFYKPSYIWLTLIVRIATENEIVSETLIIHISRQSSIETKHYLISWLYQRLWTNLAKFDPYSKPWASEGE